MKVKIQRYDKEIIFFMLIFLLYFTNSLDLKKRSNLAISKNKDDYSNDFRLDKNLLHTKNVNNVNYEVSNYEYFINSIKDFFSFNYSNDISYVNKDNRGKVNNFDNFLNYLKNEKFNFKNTKSLNYNEDILKNVEIKNCNNEVCGGLNSKCISETKCECNNGFINIPNKNFKRLCEYKLSYQLYALLFELIFPIGVGHFYCKRFLIGFIKFSVLFLIPLLVYFIYLNFYNKKNEDLPLVKVNGISNKGIVFNLDKFFGSIMTISYLIIFATWYLFDLVIFLANKHKDGSGFDLIPM